VRHPGRKVAYLMNPLAARVASRLHGGGPRFSRRPAANHVPRYAYRRRLLLAVPLAVIAADALFLPATWLRSVRVARRSEFEHGTKTLLDMDWTIGKAGSLAGSIAVSPRHVRNAQGGWLGPFTSRPDVTITRVGRFVTPASGFYGTLGRLDRTISDVSETAFALSEDSSLVEPAKLAPCWVWIWG